MEDKKIRNYYEYADGNAVRTIEMPEEVQEQEEKKSPKRKPIPEKIVKTRKKVSLGSVLLTLAATAMTFYLCISYIMLYSDIVVNEKDISDLQSQITKLKTENETEMEKIDASVNMQEVYVVATEKLGMVHAEADRVFTYKNKRSDRVIQYSNIPD